MQNKEYLMADQCYSGLLFVVIIIRLSSCGVSFISHTFNPLIVASESITLNHPYGTAYDVAIYFHNHLFSDAVKNVKTIHSSTLYSHLVTSLFFL